MSGPAGAGPIAILAAQVDEIAPLVDRLRARRDGGDRVGRYWRGAVAGTEVMIAVGGMGRRRARAAAAALLDRWSPSRLVVVGVAGALSAGLEVGTLVVAERVASEQGESIGTDPADLRVALDQGARAATIVTVDRMVSTVEERRALLEAWPRRDAAGATAVDMESYDAVALAAARHLPALVLRAISDGSSDELPAFLERCRRADGDLDRRRVVAHALSHPRSIPSLLELRRRVRLGADRLADLLVRVLPLLERHGAIQPAPANPFI